jgi:hypothetical protein
MASQKAAKSKLAAFQAAVFLNSLNRVTRTGWVVAAMVAQPGAQEQLITPNKSLK